MSYHKKIVRLFIPLLFLLFFTAEGIDFKDFRKIGSNFLENKKEWSAEVGVEFSFNGFFEDIEFEKAFFAIAIGVIAVKFAIDHYKRKEISIGHSQCPLSSVYQSEGFGSSLSPSDIEDLKEKDFQRKLAFYMRDNAASLKPLLENLFAAYEIYNLCNLHKFIYSCAKEILFDKENLNLLKDKASLKDRFKKILTSKFKFTKKICSDFCKENENKNFKEKCKNFFLKLIGKKPKQEIKIDKVSIDEVILENVVLEKLFDNLSEIFLDENSSKIEPKIEQKSIEQKEAEKIEIEKEVNEKLESDKKFLTEISENNFEINLLSLHSSNNNFSGENLLNKNLSNEYFLNKKELKIPRLEGPPRLENVAISLFEIAKDSLSGTLKNSIENPKNLVLNSLFGEIIFAYDASKVVYNLGKIGCKTAFVDYENGKNEFFEYTQPVANIINFISSNEIEFKDKAKVLTRLFFDIKTRSFVENSVRKGLICSLNSVSNKVTNLGIEFDGLLFNKKDNNNNSSGGSKGHNKNYTPPGFHSTDTPYIFTDSIEDMVKLNSEIKIANHVLRDSHSSLWKLITYLTGKEPISFEKLSDEIKLDFLNKILTESLKTADEKFPAGRIFTKIELEVHGFKIMVHGNYINDKLRISTLYLVD